MNLLRRAGEMVMSLAVIVMFAGLLTVPEPDDGGRADAPNAGEQAA